MFSYNYLIVLCKNTCVVSHFDIEHLSPIMCGIFDISYHKLYMSKIVNVLDIYDVN